MSGDEGGSSLGEAATPSTGIPELGSVHVLIDPDRVHVVLTGEVDAGTAAELATASAEALEAGLPIAIDCRYVTFMDSTGIGFLARLAARSPRRVRLLHPPAMVRFLLETVRIHELVDVVE